MNSLLEAKKILSRCLFIPIEKISDGITIYEMEGINSLSFSMIVTEVEKYLGREVSPEQLLSLESVEDLAKLLDTKNKE